MVIQLTAKQLANIPLTELQELAKENKITSSNDEEVLRNRILKHMALQSCESANKDELKTLLKRWGEAQINEISVKREICAYIFLYISQVFPTDWNNNEKTIKVIPPFQIFTFYREFLIIHSGMT